MLNRYWQWTSAGAESGVPFGPLRFRAWTSPSEAGPAATGLPFGPLRFRAWTNGIAIVPTPPDSISYPGRARFAVRGARYPDEIDEEEIIMTTIAAWLETRGTTS